MNRRQNRGKGAPNAKRPKTNNELKQNQNGVVTRAAAKKQQSSPAIFILYMDCFEEIFDYLSLKDVIAFGKTCKRLCQYADHWLRQNYPAIRYDITEECDIYMSYDIYMKIEITKFSQFIQNIRILGEDAILQKFRYISTNCNTFLNEITFHGVEFFPTEDEYFKEVLRKVEIIRIKTNEIYNDAYKTLLRSCENMKYLSVFQTKMRHSHYTKPKVTFSEKNNNWFLQKYPKLEKFHIDIQSVNKTVKDLKTFFRLNSTIREFSTGINTLLENYKYFLKSKIQLDVLSLRFVTFGYAQMLPDQLRKSVCHKLHYLYENGYYSRLHLRHDSFESHHIKLLAPFKGLVRLNVKVSQGKCNFSALSYLEDLRCGGFDEIKRWKQLPYNLSNLRRLDVVRITSDELFTVISSAVKLNEIKIITLKGGTHFNEHTNILDLVKLNNERRKLKAAQKIQIYLSETIYLATKWAFNKTNFNLIHLNKCSEACEWYKEFDHY